MALPHLSNITPTLNSIPGQSATIQGTGFNQGTPLVIFTDSQNSSIYYNVPVTAFNDTYVQFIVPAIPTNVSYYITVSNSAGKSDNNLPFGIDCGNPVISTFGTKIQNNSLTGFTGSGFAQFAPPVISIRSTSNGKIGYENIVAWGTFNGYANTYSDTQISMWVNTFANINNLPSGNYIFSVVNGMGCETLSPVFSFTNTVLCKYIPDATSTQVAGCTCQPQYSLDNGSTWQSFPYPAGVTTDNSHPIKFRGVFNTAGKSVYCGVDYSDAPEHKGVNLTVTNSTALATVGQTTVLFYTSTTQI